MAITVAQHVKLQNLSMLVFTIHENYRDVMLISLYLSSKPCNASLASACLRKYVHSVGTGTVIISKPVAYVRCT